MSDKRTIKFPAPITFKVPTEEVKDGRVVTSDQHFDLRSFVVWTVDTQSAFTSSAHGIAMGVRILGAFDNVKRFDTSDGAVAVDGPTEYIELGIEDWQALRTAIEHPFNGVWPLSPPRVLLPFINAIKHA